MLQGAHSHHVGGSLQENHGDRCEVIKCCYLLVLVPRDEGHHSDGGGGAAAVTELHVRIGHYCCLSVQYCLR